MKYGKHTFQELQEISESGYLFSGVHHDIDLVLCLDWKAAACIEGLLNMTNLRFSIDAM